MQKQRAYQIKNILHADKLILLLLNKTGEETTHDAVLVGIVDSKKNESQITPLHYTISVHKASRQFDCIFIK